MESDDLEAGDARAVEIRVATPGDARAMLALKRALGHETTFMLLEHEERTTTDADARRGAPFHHAQPNSVVLVADVDGELTVMTINERAIGLSITSLAIRSKARGEQRSESRISLSTSFGWRNSSMRTPAHR